MADREPQPDADGANVIRRAVRLLRRLPQEQGVMVTYYQRGYDAGASNAAVYWTSRGGVDNAPTTTTPALVGALTFPHVIGTAVT